MGRAVEPPSRLPLCSPVQGRPTSGQQWRNGGMARWQPLASPWRPPPARPSPWQPGLAARQACTALRRAADPHPCPPAAAGMADAAPPAGERGGFGRGFGGRGRGRGERGRGRGRGRRDEGEEKWVPTTKLGRLVQQVRRHAGRVGGPAGGLCHMNFVCQQLDAALLQCPAA